MAKEKSESCNEILTQRRRVTLATYFVGIGSSCASVVVSCQFVLSWSKPADGLTADGLTVTAH